MNSTVFKSICQISNGLCDGASKLVGKEINQNPVFCLNLVFLILGRDKSLL